MQLRRAALRIMDNPHPYYTAFARAKHLEVIPEWIERTLIELFRVEIQQNGRVCFWGAVPERGYWLRVIVDEGLLFNAFLDSNKRRRWGRPTCKRIRR